MILPKSRIEPVAIILSAGEAAPASRFSAVRGVSLAKKHTAPAPRPRQPFCASQDHGVDRRDLGEPAERRQHRPERVAVDHGGQRLPRRASTRIAASLTKIRAASP